MADRLLFVFRSLPLEKGRVEAFSDCVIGVAITLLVLDIKLAPGLPSERDLWLAVAHLLPAFLAWLVSFAFVLTLWINHHFFFSSLRHVDRGLLWINGLFLLAVSLIPFPTALVGEYPGMTPPLALLSAVMMLASSCFAWMRYYATYQAALLNDEVAHVRPVYAMVQGLIAPILYGLALGMSFLWPPGAIVIQVGVLLLFAAGRHVRPHQSAD